MKIKGRQYPIYFPPGIHQYFPIMRKWLQEKKLLDSDKTTHMVNVCVALMLNEMFKEVDRKLVDQMLREIEKKGIWIEDIDSSTFKKLLK